MVSQKRWQMLMTSKGRLWPQRDGVGGGSTSQKLPGSRRLPRRVGNVVLQEMALEGE